MEGVPLFEVSKLICYASIQMTERYTHLAPDHLHDAVITSSFQKAFRILIFVYGDSRWQIHV